jgi:hypothetical protein
MTVRKKLKKILLSEVSIFIYLWIALFLFTLLFGRGRNQVTISGIQLAFTLNYVAMTTLNNFVLLPRYLIRGKYAKYFSLGLLMIVIFGFTEEYLIEPLLLDRMRGEATLRGLSFAIFKSIFVVALFSAYKLIWDYQRKQQRLKQLEREKVESELKFLKSQISPHVLLNNLNNIYSYALEGSGKTPDMIMKLSGLMRYMLYEAREKWVSLEKEVNYLRDFVELQKVRLEDRGDVEFKVVGNREDRKIAPLLLVAFVENSFKHGMEAPDDKIHIRIHIEVDEDELRFYAENSRDPDATESDYDIESERGIGLDNVKKRLNLLYPDRHSLRFEEDEDRFYVYLTIQL